MRSIWVGLVVSAVLLAGLIGSPSQAGNRKGPAEVPSEREEDIVSGFGLNAAKANEQALANAQERVCAQLAEKLGTGWHPSKDVLDPDYLERNGVIRRLGDPVVLTLKDGDYLEAKYHVRVTRPYLQEAARIARHQHMSDRHLIAAVLVGLVALLLVITGYLRLEDLTRGYATTMLRAAAVGVLGVVGLGLWMTA